MIQSVLAVPMPSYGCSADLKTTFEWVKGPLGRLDVSGTPAMPVLELISQELNESLRWTLDRHSVDLWDTPIEVASGLSIVGLEYVLPLQEFGSEVLLIHFTGSHTNTNLDLIATYTDLSHSQTKEMLLTVLESASTSLLSRKGVAISVYQGGPGEQITAREMSLAVPTASDAPQFGHGKLAHLLTVCSSQFFALNFLGWMWPVAMVSEDDMADFRRTFNEYWGIYERQSMTMDDVAMVVYQELRTMLGIESLNQKYLDELQDQ